MITFWGQKVKGQGHRKPWERHISQTSEGNFNQFLVQMYLG